MAGCDVCIRHESLETRSSVLQSLDSIVNEKRLPASGEFCLKKSLNVTLFISVANFSCDFLTACGGGGEGGGLSGGDGGGGSAGGSGGVDGGIGATQKGQ